MFVYYRSSSSRHYELSLSVSQYELIYDTSIVIKKVTLSMIKDKVRTGNLPVKTDFIHGLFSNLSGHWGETEGGMEGGGVYPFVQFDLYYNG